MDQGGICDVPNEEVVNDVKHAVIGNTADDQILVRDQIPVSVIKRSSLYFFHASPVICHEHRPIDVGGDLQGLKPCGVQGNDVEPGAFIVTDQRQGLARFRPHIEALSKITLFSAFGFDASLDTGFGTMVQQNTPWLQPDRLRDPCDMLERHVIHRDSFFPAKVI